MGYVFYIYQHPQGDQSKYGWRCDFCNDRSGWEDSFDLGWVKRGALVHMQSAHWLSSDALNQYIVIDKSVKRVSTEELLREAFFAGVAYQAYDEDVDELPPPDFDSWWRNHRERAMLDGN